MFDLKSYLKEKRSIVNGAIEKYFSIDSNPSKLIQAMNYSIMAGGKRLRPILCIAAAKACGGSDKYVMPAACSLEMIHTYSLIHDDLPAMDNDDLRRGQPTCHKKFDEATAILAGDALLTMAFQILAHEASSNKDILAWVKTAQNISQAAGFQGMIEGQMRDIDAENNLLSYTELKNLHLLKTGALIKASVHVGVILGNASKIQEESLLKYAENIGLAFQVVDDILNVTGDPEKMGKAVGTDQALGKSTYPSLLGLDKSKELSKNLVDKAISNIKKFGDEAKPLRAIARYIIERQR